MINIGIVGYGYWGPNLVRNFSETPGVTVAAVADQDPKRLELVQRRYPAVRTSIAQPAETDRDSGVNCRPSLAAFPGPYSAHGEIPRLEESQGPRAPDARQGGA